MARSRQLSFQETLFIYECPNECHRYWDEDPHLGRDAQDGHDITLCCERCGYACRRVGSFTYNPYDYEKTFPTDDELPLTTDEGGRKAKEPA